MAKGRITLKKRKERKQQKRRYHYDDYTPVTALFKPAVYDYAIDWIDKEVKPLLDDKSASVDANAIYYFAIKEENLRRFKRSLARLLKKIGRAKGTKYGEMMIFRYFCDPLHSTILCKEDSLKTTITRELLSI